MNLELPSSKLTHGLRMGGGGKHILARSRHVVSEPSVIADEKWESSWSEPEFCFVVGIDQPQGPVYYPEVCF